jgi:uncharacterized protein
MQLNEIGYEGAKPIDGYGPGFFRIAGEVCHGATLVTATSVSGWGGFDDAAALVALAGTVDVVFVGTGTTITRLPASLRTALEGAGIGVEMMDTPAACRSYNVLLAEGRRIAAALIPV